MTLSRDDCHMSSHMNLWQELPIASGPKGLAVVAQSPLRLMDAAEQLSRIPAALKLKVRAGEHIAAILLTALYAPPIAFDTDGGVDLLFKSSAFFPGWPFGPGNLAAVEVKSLPGGWRKHESEMRIGDTYTFEVRNAYDVLDSASTVVQKATDALNKKLGDTPQAAKNVFLIIHPMDGIAVEAWPGPVIGHRLPSLTPELAIDNLWVCWYPTTLSRWSQDTRQWTDFLFGYQSQTDEVGDASLEDAEEAFLHKTGLSLDSPW